MLAKTQCYWQLAVCPTMVLQLLKYHDYNHCPLWPNHVFHIGVCMLKLSMSLQSKLVINLAHIIHKGGYKYWPTLFTKELILFNPFAHIASESDWMLNLHSI